MAVMTVLLFLDVRTNAATVAALGSSSFIVFTMPGTRSSNPRFLVGGYLVAIFTGTVCNFSARIDVVQQLFPSAEVAYPFFSAVSVGAAIFLMVITNTEHPPAGGVALGLVINDYSYIAVLIVLIGVISLAVVRAIMKPMLIDLL